MHLIVYTSEYTGDPTSIAEDLQDICTCAKRNNPAMEITGLLFYHSGQFLQIIEGEQQYLETLLAKLALDRRHCNIERLFDSEVSKRDFAQWNMDTFDLSALDSIDAQELKTIAQAYKQNLNAESGLVAKFYRQMIQSRAFQ